MSGETLLPCPFCGATDIDFHLQATETRNLTGETSGYTVECDECAGFGPHKQTKDEAHTAWNTRATPASPDRQGGVMEGSAGAVREALAWYGEQARLARLIHSEGDAGRHALANDGGKRAVDVLAASPAAPRPEPCDARGVGEGGQDRKFAFRDGQFVNRVSGEPIPADEPIIIFRARDRHALDVLGVYQGLADDPHHIRAIQDRINEFRAYKAEHPERLKEPGITRHIELNAPTPTDNITAAFLSPSADSAGEEARARLREMSRLIRKNGGVDMRPSLQDADDIDALLATSTRAAGEEAKTLAHINGMMDAATICGTLAETTHAAAAAGVEAHFLPADQPPAGEVGREEAPDEDWLAEIIDDSLDMDWTGRVGARAIIAAWGDRYGR